jgi:CRISPR/Cas system-associated protein Cas5 (RAMP superfamily)
MNNYEVGKPLKTTKYCDLLAQGTTQEGEDISAVEKIFIKSLKRKEIRFAWYKEKSGIRYFQPRPLDLTETELFELLKDGFNNGVFSDKFRGDLKKFL